MKVLFIYPDIGPAVGYSAGIGILAAYLKRAGHPTGLIHISQELDYPLDLPRINQDVRKFEPGLICISISSNQWHFARQVGRSIKQGGKIPIMVGGAHPTAASEAVMAEPWVDLLCRGEGDQALIEVVKRLAQGTSFRGIPNLIFRENGLVVEEPMTFWVEDLDVLPFEDHALFDFGRIVEIRNGWAEVIISRGCPFPCSYCFNHALFGEYHKDIRACSRGNFTKKQYVRKRSVDFTIRMLRELKESYSAIKGFTFVDDIMATEGEWLTEYARRYPQEIGLPYACTSHPLLFSRNVAALLKASGCKVVKMGIEMGNEEMRKKLLRRNISNKRLKNVFQIAQEFGLKPQSFNMLGLPGETFEQMLETVRLNALIRPYIVGVSTFTPFPGTVLYFLCRQKDMIDEEKWSTVPSFRGDSIFREEFLPHLEFKKLRTLFRWHLNANLGNEASPIYASNIKELSRLPDASWENGDAEKIFLERDREVDDYLRSRDISHYILKKNINVFWGKEYRYDLS